MLVRLNNKMFTIPLIWNKNFIIEHDLYPLPLIRVSKLNKQLFYKEELRQYIKLY